MRRIRATFIGEDGSLGYTNKYTYNLVIPYIEDSEITIRREDETGEITYSNVFTFLDNWSNISSIGDN